jgi:hypothetical protein
VIAFRSFALVVAALLAGGGDASAQIKLEFGPDLLRNGWHAMPFRNKTAVEFEADGAHAVRIVADNAASMLTTVLRFEITRFRCLAWRWRVDESTIPPTNLARRGEDDRNLIVSVGFAYVPEQLSLMERLRYGVAKLNAGREIPARVLLYVWGGRHAKDTMIESPYMEGAGFIKVLQPSPGPIGAWQDAEIDLVADYEQAFAAAPSDIVEIAIGANSDDTQMRSAGRIADLTLKPRCGS